MLTFAVHVQICTNLRSLPWDRMCLSPLPLSSPSRHLHDALNTQDWRSAATTRHISRDFPRLVVLALIPCTSPSCVQDKSELWFKPDLRAGAPVRWVTSTPSQASVEELFNKLEGCLYVSGRQCHDGISDTADVAEVQSGVRLLQGAGR